MAAGGIQLAHAAAPATFVRGPAARSVGTDRSTFAFRCISPNQCAPVNQQAPQQRARPDNRSASLKPCRSRCARKIRPPLRPFTKTGRSAQTAVRPSQERCRWQGERPCQGPPSRAAQVPGRSIRSSIPPIVRSLTTTDRFHDRQAEPLFHPGHGRRSEAIRLETSANFRPTNLPGVRVPSPSTRTSGPGDPGIG